MWIAAAIAGGVRWAWPSVFVTLKPSLGLLRLDRHPVAVVVDRRRRAGARQPAVPVAVARLPDRRRATPTPRSGTHSVTCRSSSCRSSRISARADAATTPILTWTAWLLRGGGWAARQKDDSMRSRWPILAIFVLSGRRRPRLRDRLVAPAGPRLRQHDPGRVGDPGRVLRRHGDRQRGRRAARRPRAFAAPAVRHPRTRARGRRPRHAADVPHHPRRSTARSPSALEDAPQLLALIRLGLALLALAPATVLMGATLPTLTRHLSATPI